jgi:hypothetical protein
VFVRFPSGIVVPTLGIHLSPREISDSYAWFQLVTRGLYCFEFGLPLPADHSIHLLWRKDGRFNICSQMSLNDPNTQTRTLAGGEFRYAFTANRIEEMSLWFYTFKSIRIFALTLSAACPANIKSFVTRIEWPPLDEASP